MRHRGSCHCGAVKFEVDLEESIEVEDCNCSICNKTGFLHVILPLSKFSLDNYSAFSEHPDLSCYQFNTGVAKHYFCKRCGIKPFYIPRSNPDGIDVNLRCLDTRPETVNIVMFDGQNWEDNAARLAHKSQ